MRLHQTSEGIKVKGHIGTWSVIDWTTTDEHGIVYLLEHEEHGDEAACLIVDGTGKILLEDVHNGLVELECW